MRCVPCKQGSERINMQPRDQENRTQRRGFVKGSPGMKPHRSLERSQSSLEQEDPDRGFISSKIWN